MIKKLTFVAPFLVAIFTVITLYQANAERLAWSSVLMPAVLSLMVAGLFLLLFWLLKWTSPAAPFVASGFTLVFLLWYTLTWPIALFALVAVLIVGIGSKRHTQAASVLIITIAIIGSMVAGGQAARIAAAGPESGVNQGPYINKPGQPNIYFIIPDRMPSPAAMRESGIDPDQLITKLRGLGFYVTEDQVSKDKYHIDYPEKIYTTRTMRYFASVLNGGLDIPMTIKYQDCRSLIRDNAAFTWLHGKGYSIVNVPSWFTETAYFTDQDQVYKFTDVTLLERFMSDELGEAYFSRTILNGFNFRAFESFGSQRRIETERLKYQASRNMDIANQGPSSTFVMTHLTLPHEPYIFGDPDDPIPEQYYANVRSALIYLDELLTEILTADPTAIVLVQSDEGMAYRKPKDLNYELSAVQWSGIFSAWYIPNFTGLWNGITHTNILGVVLESK